MDKVTPLVQNGSQMIYSKCNKFYLHRINDPSQHFLTFRCFKTMAIIDHIAVAIATVKGYIFTVNPACAQLRKISLTNLHLTPQTLGSASPARFTNNTSNSHQGKKKGF
jgi:hypothetical protein